MRPDPDVTVERLRAPSAGDRAAILAIEAESFTNPWTAATFDSMFETPVSQVFVARARDAGVVAFCACWVIDDEVHINTVAVAPAVRRRGIASRLLTDVLRLTGAGRATLEVRRANTAALAMYARLGFRTTGVRPNYYDRPVDDALILWWNP